MTSAPKPPPHAGDFWLVLDRDGRVESWHPEPPERAPLVADTWFPPVDRPLFQKGLERARSGEQVRELRCRELQSGPLWQEYGFTPLSGSRVLCWCRDVTEERLAVEAREAAHREAVDYAQKKNEFFAMMSHEIRTPLSGVTVISRLLLETDLKPDQRELVEKMRRGGENLLRIVGDLLDMSRADSGRLELEKAPFSIAACLEEVADLLAPQIGTKAVELVTLPAVDLPRAVMGDGARFRQILLNLGGNAVKFTERGEVSLSATARPTRAGEVELRVSVKDTGMGIPIDAWSRLFQAFSQVHDAGHHRFGGTGLGLALCKRLTELMGGRIWVESAVGRGSTFHVSIPLPVVEGPGAPPLLSGKSVVVVDGHLNRRNLTVAQVAAHGGQATGFATIDEAVASGRDDDRWVLDMGLAGAEEILTERKARGRTTLRVRGLAAPGEADLRKPYAWARLVALLSGTGAEASKPTLDRELGKKHPLRLLLVEDDHDNRQILLLLLKRLGYGADTAVDGMDALEKLKQQPYDGVFMDMQMPRMGGLDATRALRALSLAQPRVVALTANAIAGEREKCLDAGMDDYLSKPVNPESLSRALLAIQPLPGGGTKDA